MKSLVRYPGGKSKLSNQICSRLAVLLSEGDYEYREPFFGGGIIGLSMLGYKLLTKSVWINDVDPGIAQLWTAVIHPTAKEMLKGMIRVFRPSVDKFNEFKETLLRKPCANYTEELAYYGCMKLAVHQMSYSGLGTMAGGPIGGVEQDEAKYKVDCRWNADSLCKKIDNIHKAFAGVEVVQNRCTGFDFQTVIQDLMRSAVLYLDPPYYQKGNELYQHSFTEDDHERLAFLLVSTRHHWLLSYDDCPQVRELYSWAHIEELGDVNYSITNARKKTELLIMPKDSPCRT
jgi:DNA adenine methylase